MVALISATFSVEIPLVMTCFEAPFAGFAASSRVSCRSGGETARAASAGELFSIFGAAARTGAAAAAARGAGENACGEETALSLRGEKGGLATLCAADFVPLPPAAP